LQLLIPVASGSQILGTADDQAEIEASASLVFGDEDAWFVDRLFRNHPCGSDGVFDVGVDSAEL
jgi:hypothetical protein